MSEDDLKAIDAALLKAWHLGVSNGIDSESEFRSASKRAGEAREGFRQLREHYRDRLRAIMRRKAHDDEIDAERWRMHLKLMSQESSERAVRGYVQRIDTAIRRDGKPSIQ